VPPKEKVGPLKRLLLIGAGDGNLKPLDPKRLPLAGAVPPNRLPPEVNNGACAGPPNKLVVFGFSSSSPYPFSAFSGLGPSLETFS
jgi:hypothetical protein